MWKAPSGSVTSHTAIDITNRSMDQRFPVSPTLSYQGRASAKTLCSGSVVAVGHSESELPIQIKTATARKLSCGPGAEQIVRIDRQHDQRRREQAN